MKIASARVTVLRHAVYVITGPRGSYVGCTSRPAARWNEHRLAGIRGTRSTSSLRLHAAMHADGVEHYRFEVVAECSGYFAGVDTEVAVALQLRAEGVPLFNFIPGHPAQRAA